MFSNTGVWLFGDGDGGGDGDDGLWFYSGSIFLVVLSGNICLQQASFSLLGRESETAVFVLTCHLLPKLQNTEPPGEDASWERIHKSHLLYQGTCQIITVLDLMWQGVGLPV